MQKASREPDRWNGWVGTTTQREQSPNKPICAKYWKSKIQQYVTYSYITLLIENDNKLDSNFISNLFKERRATVTEEKVVHEDTSMVPF